MDLILASTSPYRKMLLDSRGLQFKAIAPDCDEEVLKDPNLNGTELTQKLALAKAESLRQKFPNALIIGSDQVLEFEGQIFGKPKTKECALAQLLQLQGQKHQLVTSFALISPKQTWIHTEIVYLEMHSWSEIELKKYIDADLPLDCAGSYKLEKKGLILFKSIQANDYESIIGLPLIKLFSLLKELDFPLFE